MSVATTTRLREGMVGATCPDRALLSDRCPLIFPLRQLLLFCRRSAHLKLECQEMESFLTDEKVSKEYAKIAVGFNPPELEALPFL